MGGTGDDSSSGSSTGATAASNTTMTATSNGSADGTSSTGVVDTGAVDTSSSGAEVTTEPGTTTSGTGTTDGSSSGEPPQESYPGCMADEDCPEPYTLCWPPIEFGMPNFCTLECMDAGDCPLGTSGTAVPVCEGPPGTDICVLDCTDGECPDGMTCIDVFGDGSFLRCTRT